MVCVYCRQKTRVINSRLQKRSNSVWRRRQCQNCAALFTTHEEADFDALWRVSSKSSGLTPFSRDKLFLSLYKSLQHRSTAATDAASLTTTVIAKLANAINDGLVPINQIITTVLSVLTHFDSSAEVSYRAFHRLKS